MNLREQLQAIYDEQGRLTPALVVDAARGPDHPLHSRFEWDDAVAGEAYRQGQAHELIRSVRVVYTNKTGEFSKVRAFHAVRDGDGFAYRSTDEILTDPLMTKMLLADMEREWRTLKGRYDRFQEFRELVLADMAEAS